MKQNVWPSNLFTAVLLVLAGLAFYYLVARPVVLSGGATEAEAWQVLPGDDIVAGEAFQNTLAVTVEAPARDIWPWVIQLGQDRAGFYSHEFLEDVFPCQINNADTIVPAWQQRAVGEYVPVCPIAGGWWVETLEPGQALVFRGKVNEPWSMALVLTPLDGDTTRLLARMRYPEPVQPVLAFLEETTLQPIHSLMQRGMIVGIQSLAEGRGLASAATEGFVWGAAFLGCCVAGVWLLVRRQWWQVVLLYLAAEYYLALLLWWRPSPWTGALLDAGLLLVLYFLVIRQVSLPWSRPQEQPREKLPVLAR